MKYLRLFEQKETNVTSDLDIPLDAFISVREEDYEDDDDFIPIKNLGDSEKKRLIQWNSLFLVDLFPYKDVIKTELISTK